MQLIRNEQVAGSNPVTSFTAKKLRGLQGHAVFLLYLRMRGKTNFCLADKKLSRKYQEFLHPSLSPPHYQQLAPRGTSVTADEPRQHIVCLRAQSSLTLCDPMDCIPPDSSIHGILQAMNTGVSCHFLLQGMFLTQRSNPRLLHLLLWQAGSLPLCHPVIINIQNP